MAAAALSVAAAAALPWGRSGDPAGPGWTPASVDATTLVRLEPAASSLPAWNHRVAARPADGLNHEGLGRLLMRHGKEAGDDAAFVRAEHAFRATLARIPGRIESRLGLADALAAQHRFAEARAIAEEIWAEDDGRLEALALIADAAIETGDYRGAGDAIDALVARSSAPAARARLARLRELEGRHDEAIALLERAAVAARDANALGDRMAWYLMRLADLHLAAGRVAEAEAHADVAVAAWPDGLGPRATRARVLAVAGRHSEAIAAYRDLSEKMPHPEVLAALGDLYAATGEQERAEAIWTRVLAAGDAAGELEDRPMARFLADHDLRPTEAIERAQRDLRARPDVHAWDNLAWALFKGDRIEEAREAMDRALALGTREAAMRYHAGMIAAATGDGDRAVTHLRDALERLPGFDPLQAPRARAALTRLLSADR